MATFLTYLDLYQKYASLHEEFFFEPTGIITAKDGSIVVPITFRAKPAVIVSELHLMVEGKRFTPKQWQPVVVNPQYSHYWGFDTKEVTERGHTYKGQLISVVGGREHKSREFDVFT